MELGELTKKSFGKRLERMREKAGFKTSIALANALGVHRNTIYQLERGQQWISADLLEKICAHLEITPDRLFTDTEPTPTPEEALEVLSRAIKKPHTLQLVPPEYQEEVLSIFAAFEKSERDYFLKILRGRNRGANASQGSKRQDANRDPTKFSGDGT